MDPGFCLASIGKRSFIFSTAGITSVYAGFPAKETRRPNVEGTHVRKLNAMGTLRVIIISFDPGGISYRYIGGYVHHEAMKSNAYIAARVRYRKHNP